MGKIETFQQSGVTMAGVKYMFLSGSDKVIRAKKSTDGLHIMKTTQAVIICKYGEPDRNMYLPPAIVTPDCWNVSIFPMLSINVLSSAAVTLKSLLEAQTLPS